MKRLAAALVLLGVFSLRGQTAPAPPRATPQPRTGIIRGRVTAVETGLPISNAHLSLTTIAGARDGAAGGFEPILSDAEGRFQFVDVPAGRYTVLAAKAGYLNARFGATNYFDRPVTVVLVDGAAVDGINLRLTKSAAISGRIVDDLGDPAVGANVSVSRRVRIDGREQLSSLKGTRTDDLGEYRLGGLPAGDFIVTVGGGGGAATRWTRTFFPGVIVLARAQPVTVGAGDEIGERNFAASPVGAAAKPARLSGAIVNADGSPATGRLIVATIDEPPGTASTSSRPIPANGEFSFQAEPGDHVLIAQGPGGVAGLRVTLEGADVTGLRLVMMKGGLLSGRIVFEKSALPPPSDIEIEAWSPDFSPAMGLASSGPPGASATSFQPKKANRDGAFELDNLFGARELRVRGVPAGWTVKSITHEGRSIAEVPIDFGGAREVTGVQVLLSDRTAELTGVVTDGRGQAITEYSVVVFPDDQARVSRPSRVARWVRPDQTGRFTVDGLAPGTYLVAAVDEVIDGQWPNREYLDSLGPRATRVTLADGEKKTVSLERIAP